MNRLPVSGRVWAGIRTDFILPALEQVRRGLTELMEDPDPVMQQLVRVFIADGTFCPGLQFLPDGRLHPTVLILFQRALELDIPHNYFATWMVTPCRDLAGTRPVGLFRSSPAPLYFTPLEPSATDGPCP